MRLCFFTPPGLSGVPFGTDLPQKTVAAAGGVFHGTPPAEVWPARRGGTRGFFVGGGETKAAQGDGRPVMTARPFRYDFSLWYCLEDDPVATAISATLRSRGFRGYVEHQDHVAGTPRVATANEIIEGSRVAILLLSPRSVADPWFRRVAEWNIVRTIDQDGTKVIPVYVGLSTRKGRSR
ncbi:hypothetical protein JRQ81_008940 [Phrynocephalus forsythii]|uniref:TIR domain-containing protein n=1 Tax=Phrynocephalus forsythii TaxID=171643 RepID=A0A9Q0XB47_9SAUR|nr:hypothetical protein JRQ81_008940 [Phrynocephalus forsythii]